MSAKNSNYEFKNNNHQENENRKSLFKNDLELMIYIFFCLNTRVSVQGVKSLGGHFACLCRGFDFYEVKKKMLLFFKKKREILLHV